MPDTRPAPRPGIAQHLAPGLRRVLAPNPGPMTQAGTNTYLVGDGDIAVIDPGPDLPGHLDAILRALRPGERITHIFVTHAHRDHSALAGALGRAADAPVLAFGTATEGRSAAMQALAADGLEAGAGLDAAFAPDIRLTDGAEVAGPSWRMTALHTPGHAAGHLCLRWQDAVFSGDTVMGWASTVVAPPDGDLGAYMASTARLARLGARVFHPGHGAPIAAPAARCRDLLAHRRARETQILDRLASPATIRDIMPAIYPDLPPGLRPAGMGTVFGHLVALAQGGQVRASPKLCPDAVFSRS